MMHLDGRCHAADVGWRCPSILRPMASQPQRSEGMQRRHLARCARAAGVLTLSDFCLPKPHDASFYK